MRRGLKGIGAQHGERGFRYGQEFGMHWSLQTFQQSRGARFSMHWSRQTFQQSRAERAAGGGGAGGMESGMGRFKIKSGKGGGELGMHWTSYISTIKSGKARGRHGGGSAIKSGEAGRRQGFGMHWSMSGKAGRQARSSHTFHQSRTKGGGGFRHALNLVHFNNQEQKGGGGEGGVQQSRAERRGGQEFSNAFGGFSMHWSRQTFQQSRAERAAGGGGGGRGVK